MFRLLREDEIDVRIATINQKGASLLLYKDARCDMNILDETVGAFNWKRSHTRENANCVVSLWDENKLAKKTQEQKVLPKRKRVLHRTVSSERVLIGELEENFILHHLYMFLLIR